MGILIRNKTGNYQSIGLGKYTDQLPKPGRILIDLGSNQYPTPSIDSATGYYWNNISEDKIVSTSYPQTYLTNPVVDTLNNLVNGFSFSVDKMPAGSYPASVGNAPGNALNLTGVGAQVGDYPATATIDSLYLYSDAGIVTFTFNIPSGKSAVIKIWGSRAVSDATRILQARKAGDSTWSESNQANNTDYNNAITFSGITGTQNIEMQVKAGASFGYVGVLDITLS